MNTLIRVAPVFVVRDLDRAIAYYNQLGFSIEFVYEGTYASVQRDGCRVHLKRGAPVERDQDAFEVAENIDAFFLVADAAALADELRDAGATVVVALRTSPYGKEFYVKDPDQHVLAFVESVPI